MVGLFKNASRNVRFLPPHVSVAVWLIQTTDISFPRNRKGSVKTLKTLWRSTMGVQSPSTLPTDATGASRVGCRKGIEKIMSRKNSTASALFIVPQHALWQFKNLVNFRKLNLKN